MGCITSKLRWLQKDEDTWSLSENGTCFARLSFLSHILKSLKISTLSFKHSFLSPSQPSRYHPQSLLIEPEDLYLYIVTGCSLNIALFFKNSGKFATSPSPAFGFYWLYKKLPVNRSDCTLGLR